MAPKNGSLSLYQRLGFDVVYRQGGEREGMRNECFSVSKVCQRQITLVPSDTVAPSSYQWYKYMVCNKDNGTLN